MIRIDSISKRHGRQILFLEASAVVNRGEKVGLVGPNGAGKTTIFRLITREEEPDDGQVSIDRGTTVGYFSQDIGEMKGRTVVEATLDGAGPVSDAARSRAAGRCASASRASRTVLARSRPIPRGHAAHCMTKRRSSEVLAARHTAHGMRGNGSTGSGPREHASCTIARALGFDAS